MPQHTPGPWSTHMCDDTSIVDRDGRDIAQICGDYRHPDIWPVTEANARLIAAAPEMLEALKIALAAFKAQDRMDVSAVHVIEEAIDKAEGRA